MAGRMWANCGAGSRRIREDTRGMQSRAVDVLRTNIPVDRVRDYSPPKLSLNCTAKNKWSDEGVFPTPVLPE